MQQQQEQYSDDLGTLCPSFSCYSSDTQASSAASRISDQLMQQETVSLHEEEEFEFKLLAEGIEGFPLFNRDLIVMKDIDHEEEVEDVVSITTTSLEKLFLNEREQTGSSSSSEDDEPEGDAPVAFCVWKHKNDAGASPLSKCKKSRSTGSGSGSGSGSRRWRIRDLLRRSNSEGKEPVVRFGHKKVEIQKQKLNAGEGAVVAGKLKPSSSLLPSVHEVFYVQQRAKREVVKRKSYLPYRQGLVGFFSNVNGNR